MRIHLRALLVDNLRLPSCNPVTYYANIININFQPTIRRDKVQFEYNVRAGTL